MIITDTDARSLEGYNDTQRSQIAMSLATVRTELRDLDLAWQENSVPPPRRGAVLVVGDLKIRIFEHGKGSFWAAECDYLDKRTQWASHNANTYIECWIAASLWLIKALKARAEDAVERLDPDAPPRKPNREDHDENNSFCPRAGVGGCILPAGHKDKCAISKHP